MGHRGRNTRRNALLRRFRRSQALAVAFSWVMALQLLLHGVMMLLPVGGGGNGLSVICSLNGPRQAPGGTGNNAAGQLPPCCTSGNCCCMPGAAPLPSAPTIPRVAAPVHAPFRPIVHKAHAKAAGWRWQARAPPVSV